LVGRTSEEVYRKYGKPGVVWSNIRGIGKCGWFYPHGSHGYSWIMFDNNDVVFDVYNGSSFRGKHAFEDYLRHKSGY
jgi:hypothetical protein